MRELEWGIIVLVGARNHRWRIYSDYRKTTELTDPADKCGGGVRKGKASTKCKLIEVMETYLPQSLTMGYFFTAGVLLGQWLSFETSGKIVKIN